MSLVETLDRISSAMDKLIDFTVGDEDLCKDFEAYLSENKIEAQRQTEINALLVEYILDCKMKSGKKILDYIMQKEGSFDRDIISAFKKSFVSVFRINKILKNAYQTTCLANETDFELIPLVKITNLRGVGLYDYIKARMIEIEGTFYLLEIFDCFGTFREYQANVETVKCLIKFPESQTMYNKTKLEELKASVKLFNDKFLSAFECDEIIVNNTLADDLIREFNVFVEQGTEFDPKKYKNSDMEYDFFELEENNEEDFVKNAAGGFKTSKKPYNIGFCADPDLGLFIVPFLGSLNKILKENSLEAIKNGKECVLKLLCSNRMSPNLLIKKGKEFKNLINIINEATKKDFKEIREVLSLYKGEFSVENKFSPTIVLYNSKIFEKLIGQESDFAEIK